MTDKTKIIYFALGYEMGIKDTIANMQKIACNLSEEKLGEIAVSYIEDIDSNLCGKHND